MYFRFSLFLHAPREQKDMLYLRRSCWRMSSFLCTLASKCVTPALASGTSEWACVGNSHSSKLLKAIRMVCTSYDAALYASAICFNTVEDVSTSLSRISSVRKCCWLKQQLRVIVLILIPSQYLHTPVRSAPSFHEGLWRRRVGRYDVRCACVCSALTSERVVMLCCVALPLVPRYYLLDCVP